ncbi:glutathione S-transferase 2-like [Schistocerca cancellata]|uniref:glutathione S-transferase 2-like n=1 Tax=Schistocerca cancellata TaxID=274614 RepID=UPI0021178475|nr:glutathione S-transferase 2-like [Schistocerca cancellata]
MPTITVYGNDLSPPARAARMVAEAVGLDVDLKRTYPLRGECKKPEYIKKKEPSDELRDNLVDGLETLERFLTTNKFLAGDNLTIADYCCYCTITFLDFPKKGRVDLSKYKNIQRWMDLLQNTSPLFKKYDQIREKAIQKYLEDGKY